MKIIIVYMFVLSLPCFSGGDQKVPCTKEGGLAENLATCQDLWKQPTREDRDEFIKQAMDDVFVKTIAPRILNGKYGVCGKFYNVKEFNRLYHECKKEIRNSSLPVKLPTQLQTKEGLLEVIDSGYQPDKKKQPKPNASSGKAPARGRIQVPPPYSLPQGHTLPLLGSWLPPLPRRAFFSSGVWEGDQFVWRGRCPVNSLL